MSLYDLIVEHCNEQAAAGDWDSVAAVMSDENITVRNPHAWTIGELSLIVGLEGAAAVAYTIDKAGEADTPTGGLMRSIAKAVSTVGVSLHTDERQGMIDTLAEAGKWPDALRDAIKAAGVTYTSLAGSAVTAQQCKTEYETRTLENQWASALNDGGINAALAAGNRISLAAALRAEATTIEGQ